MADTKISALPASTTPLAGTEVLPIVQGGATVKVSVANLTAGRAISATQMTLTTGNLIVASGQGIDFSATPGTGTSELLADYEEGTWTPTVTGSVSNPTITYSTASTGGLYTKIGNVVYFSFEVRWSAVSGGSGDVRIAGLPFARKAVLQPDGDYCVLQSRGVTYLGDTLTGGIPQTLSYINVVTNDQTGGANISLQCSGLGIVSVGFLRGSGFYYV